LDVGAVDDVFEEPQRALRAADVAVFCTPILTIPLLVSECRQAIAKHCVVTDVGSTKAELVRHMAALARDNGFQYVGSHPMAGSEKSGIECSRADLYQGAVTAVTPTSETPAAATEAVSALWRMVGARVLLMNPDQHDRLVARTSHLPHLVAALLVETSGREGADDVKSLIGPGFRDTTRIAGGAPDMWHDIVRSNQRLINLVESGDFIGVKRLLETQADLRKELLS
jgi:prephenate dehydrogenase